MIIFEIISEFISEVLGRFFIEFIYGKIILGIPKLCKKGIKFIWDNLFGLKKTGKSKKITSSSQSHNSP